MNMKSNKRWVIGITVLCLLIACIGYRYLAKAGSPYRLEVIRTEDSGYGYKIHEGKRTLIVQPFIPVVAGKRSFKTLVEAASVGHLVLNRIAAGEDFAVSSKDLEHLGISLND